jgi:hypothetical protein
MAPALEEVLARYGLAEYSSFSSSSLSYSSLTYSSLTHAAEAYVEQRVAEEGPDESPAREVDDEERAERDPSWVSLSLSCGG